MKGDGMEFKLKDRVRVGGKEGTLDFTTGDFWCVRFDDGEYRGAVPTETLRRPGFKVGDRVRIASRPKCSEGCGGFGKGCYIGEERIIKSIDPYLKAYKLDNTVWCSGIKEENLELVERGKTVSKHEELEKRIDDVTCWDKGADDIREEICKKTDYGIRLHHYPGQIGAFCIFDTIKSNIQADTVHAAVAKFDFSTQYGKLEAFKKTLMWLLDHSNIKKDLCGTIQQVKIEGKVYEAQIIKEV